ncbi:5-aminolevulinate synthase [Streptacidiphilus fuscans]|uniref:8-amino-7-oxononanoate synthase n=1 Tax=Streptacidiphilus fuscans TaxID=2789292 RepID=A0A931FK26_9ACTN|nr:5-aminolevulinate synthase [Streptacidiphilus fuscans]MBF9073294.1 5-aminolevulinate synthase [Streptacidiphilus fuscans]
MTITAFETRQPTVFDSFEERIEQLKQSELYREFLPVGHLAADPGHTMYQGRKIEVWCSNDYLGMSQNPEVIRAQLASTALHGTGTGGSRNIAGTSTTHVELERRLAAWHGKERALTFSSGYVANFETLSTLIAAIDDMVVFSDSLNHRSLIEGIIRSGATKEVFAHNDLVDLEEKLARYAPDRPKLIVFESVYSMDGDVSPASAIFDLAEKYQALTFLDETHSIGVRGATGAGLSEELDDHRATFVQGVFGKAIGTVGGYVAGPDAALDYVRSHAPGFIFTTAMPQAAMDATLRSLELVQAGTGMRAELNRKTALMKAELRSRDIDFIDADSHLVPVMVPGGERVRRVSRALLEKHDIYVQPINFPSVARGGERFRVTVGPFRTEAQITHFAASMQQCLHEN